MVNIKNDDKNMIMIMVRDISGCSHVRLRWNAVYYNAFEHIGIKPVICPFPSYDPLWLSKTKAIIFQRFLNKEDIEIVQRYKVLQPKYGYKMVFEVDDQIFRIDGQAIPEYNYASDNFNKLIDDMEINLHPILNMMDEIVVSTDYLKKQMQLKFAVNNVTTVKNVVPRYLWSFPRKKDITEDLIKPSILYSGSPCHYRNPTPARQPSVNEPKGFPGIPPMKGDFDGFWIDWIIENVKNDKIDFMIMGNIPWFFREISSKIKFIRWADCNSYPRKVMELNADFQIAPLVNNSFNKCKSSLRHTESAASGSVFLGNVFDNDNDSPYEECHTKSKIPTNITKDDFDKRFWDLCKKDNYNDVLNWQYEFVNKNGLWLESTAHANQWLTMLDGEPNEKFI